MTVGGQLATRLAELERELCQAPCEQLPALLGEFARLQAIGLARLAANGRARGAEEPDELLTAKQAAKRLGLSKDFVYRTKELPFRVPVGRRVRFSAHGIERYIRQRQGKVRG